MSNILDEIQDRLDKLELEVYELTKKPKSIEMAKDCAVISVSTLLDRTTGVTSIGLAYRAKDTTTEPITSVLVVKAADYREASLDALYSALDLYTLNALSGSQLCICTDDIFISGKFYRENDSENIKKKKSIINEQINQIEAYTKKPVKFQYFAGDKILYDLELAKKAAQQSISKC